MGDSEILDLANQVSNPHGLKASFLGDEKTLSVGVGGDHRTYTRILVLDGIFPGNDVLADISTKISNIVGINRVTFNVTPLINKNP